MSVYAFICWACQHRVVIHTSKDGDAPFRCHLCECEITIDSPTLGLSKREYAVYKAKHPEDTGWVAP